MARKRSPRSSAKAAGSARTPRPRSRARACRPARSRCIVRAHIRYAGTDTPLIVEAGTLAKMKSAFEKAHKARFGFIDRSKELVVEAVSVEAVGGGAKFRERDAQDHARQAPRARPHDANSSPAANGTRPRSTPATSSRPARRSPARPSSSSRTRPSWSRTAGGPRSPRRTISCWSASCRSPRAEAIGTKADPVMLEVFNNLFMSIAEQMGVSLQNTAYSVNIKERLDFSCAVFAADGTLVANAPHMPVHLGSMDRAVETIIRENKGMIGPGDVLPDQRALQRRHAPARHHRLHAGVRRARSKKILFWVAEPRPSRRRRRHRAGLDVADRDLDRGGRRLHRQLQAGRSRPLPRGASSTTC